MRVNDDGRAYVERDAMSPMAAADLAGRMRDRQTDEDIEAGWNVLAMGAADVVRTLRSAKEAESAAFKRAAERAVT